MLFNPLERICAISLGIDSQAVLDFMPHLGEDKIIEPSAEQCY
jgi:hypothetical protein